MRSSCLLPAFWRATSLLRKYPSHGRELQGNLCPFLFSAVSFFFLALYTRIEKSPWSFSYDRNIRITFTGTSLAVQLLRLRAGGLGSIPAWGTKILSSVPGRLPATPRPLGPGGRLGASLRLRLSCSHGTEPQGRGGPGFSQEGWGCRE